MCTPDAAAEKARLRREMLRIRRRISGAEREAASRRIEAGVREWLMRRSVQSVFCYVSYAEEVETHRLLQWMAAQGIAVSVPRVQEADMQAVRWAPGCPMRPNRWGIPEPVDMPRAQGAELAILPGLAFSEDGQRLGYGGGYYDRWLAGHACRAVGLCADWQWWASLPTEPHDRRMDAIFGETRQLFFTR